MLIISLPWDRFELELLEKRSDLFDLYMENSTQQYYLVIQGNRITWLGQGTVPGQVSYQINTRSFTMNGEREHTEYHGKVGFLGDYSDIDDAVHKLFPQKGYCVMNMQLREYTGQAIKGNKNHYNVIEPILCLMGKDPVNDLQHFFENLGWGKRPIFGCSGTFGRDMRLFIDNKETDSLESWFLNYCKFALESNDSCADGDSKSNIGTIIFVIALIFIIFKGCGS